MDTINLEILPEDALLLLGLALKGKASYGVENEKADNVIDEVAGKIIAVTPPEELERIASKHGIKIF